MNKEIHVDIGGGYEAEYFASQASIDSNGLFIVLEPKLFRRPYDNVYPNLQLIRGGISQDWDLPFKDHVVDQVSMNFIFDQMLEHRRGSEAAYRLAVFLLKRIIKKGGLIHVMEADGQIANARSAFYSQGFTVSEPQEVSDTSMTQTALAFQRSTHLGCQFADRHKIQFNYQKFIPMEFNARL